MTLIPFINSNYIPIAKNIRLTLAAGLLVSCVLVTIIGLTFWQALNQLHHQIEDFVEATDIKTGLIYDMRIAARERNLRLMMILIKNDPFGVDDEWMKFREQGGLFLIAREKLLKFNLDEEELSILNKQRELSRKAVELQYQIYDYIMGDDQASSLAAFNEHLIAQEKVFEVIDKLLKMQKNKNRLAMISARESRQAALRKLVILCSAVVLVIFIITAYTIKRISQQAVHIENEAIKFKALIEGSMDAVLVLDKNKVIDCNKNALKMFSVESLSELNKTGLNNLSSFTDDISSNDSLEIFSAVNQMLINSKKRYHWRVTTVNGMDFPADVELTGICLEGNNYVQMVIRDVSEREKTQNELREANESLEIKVQQRTQELKELNSNIAGIARSAGMAEVASGVLHNVGNVLNSVNVSTSILKSQIKSGKSRNLDKLAKLLAENKDDMCNFLQNDPKGKFIIPYLDGLSNHMDIEQKKQIVELTSLSDNIEHIKNIIAMQQSYAGSIGIIEQVDATEVFDDSLKINSSSIEKHKISVQKKYDYKVDITVDKHKLIQVLVNLISNAVHAVTGMLDDKKEITLGTVVGDEEQKNIIVFYVEDNGIGIETSDLDRLFEFGFKRRTGGHGYGLHHSALMAKELGGKIEVESKGQGKGAKFTLSIPVESVSR